MLHGQDCYDQEISYTLPSHLTKDPLPLITSWNPPWTFVLLSPFLTLPFEQSAVLWLLVEVALLSCIVSVVPYALELPRLPLLGGALVAATFFPALSSMYFGQLGILLTTSVAMFLYFQQKRMSLWAGIALLPLTTKPHLFFLFIPPGIKWIVQISNKERHRFLLGSIGGFTILVALTYLIAPSSISSWLHHLSSSSTVETKSSVVPFQDWMTATLATWTRIVISSITHHLPTWPLVAFPLIGTIASAAYFLKDRSPLLWTRITPPLLCLSLLMSNYGWAFDQSPLLICQIIIICRSRHYSSRYARCGMIAAAMSVQLAACLLSRYADAPQHYYVWIPVAILILLISDRRIREREQTSAGCPAN